MAEHEAVECVFLFGVIMGARKTDTLRAGVMHNASWNVDDGDRVRVQ